MFSLLSLVWDLFGSLFGTLSLPPQDPLKRNIWDAKLLRLGHDQSGDVGGEFFPMGPFLDGCFSYGTAQRRGELAVTQGDAFPRREHVQQHRQPRCYWDSFRACFGLDR